MEKDKDIIEIIVDDPIVSEENISKYSIKKLFSRFNIPPLFVKLYVVSILFIVAAALTAGILVPKSGNAVDRRLNSLHSSDKSYVEAHSLYEDTQNEKKQLEKRLEEKKTELERLNNSQNNLDKLAQKNAELEDEKKQLQDEINLKQKTLSALEISLDSYIRSSVTLSSGRYTVGENLAEGKYTITGTGSIVVSNSGTARINKTLKSDGESITLKNGDIIKLDGNAKLVLE